MTRDQLAAFLRALLATFLAGMLLWIFAKLGVHVPVPSVTQTTLQICSTIQEHQQ